MERDSFSRPKCCCCYEELKLNTAPYHGSVKRAGGHANAQLFFGDGRGKVAVIRAC
jgi:hypothetical protein